MTNITPSYKGRFAPSPTGELHFGSLLAALSSYLDAKKQKGLWLVRIEDLDLTRVQANSAKHILKTLEDFGFEWDENVIYQSERNDLYECNLRYLKSENLIYACDCSRNKLKQQLSFPVYPGTCRDKRSTPTTPYALRCKTPPLRISINDQIQGQYSVNLNHDCGDFIVKRRDNLFAYHLAVVSDDAEQGITDIVRGADLLTSTPQQAYLQQQLNLSQPVYSHIPIAMHKNGLKLSKSHQDLPIRLHNPVEIMNQALIFLNQNPPEELSKSSLNEFWQWAIENWKIEKIENQIEKVFSLDL